MIQSIIYKKKINVVALGARDYYEVAIGLSEKGALGCLVTDFYCPRLLRSFVKKRFSPRLDSKNTMSIWWLLMLIKIPLAIVFRDKAKMNPFIDLVFGYVAAFITYMTGRNAVVYSYYALGFAKFINHFNVKDLEYVVFQVHPTPWFVSEVLSLDQAKHTQKGGGIFRAEQDINWSASACSEYFDVLKSASGIICASEVTKKSLIYNHENVENVRVAPYGSRFGYHTTLRQNHGPLKLLTVSSVSQRKGFHYAFDAVKDIDGLSWTIIGGNPDQEIVKMAPEWVTFTDRVSDEKLSIYFSECDLFIMPSLVEGFGLVYLEAISQGAAILCSNQTGISEVVKDYESALIVTIGSVQEISERIYWALSHRSELPVLSKNANTACAHMNWANFERLTSDAAYDFFNK